MQLNTFFWCINSIAKKVIIKYISNTVIAFIKGWNRHQTKNNSRYKGNTDNTSAIIFLKVKNSRRCYFAWENPRGSFCCCCNFISFLIFILLLFFIHIYFSTSSLTLPWTIARFLHPFYTFSPAHRRVIRDTFIFKHSVIFLPRALRFWVGVFYPQAFFTLRSFTDIFDSTCVYQGFPGSRQFFLEVCRASYWSSKHRPGPSVCLIHSNPQSSYSEEFIFKFYHILSWITCGKKFSLYAPYSFRTIFACSKSYVKTIKNTLNKTRHVQLITASINIKVILDKDVKEF